MPAPSVWPEINTTTVATLQHISNITNNFNNDSYYGTSPVFPSYIRTTATVICSFIMGIGVLGNVMVPIVIFKSKDMRNSTNVFLMNLSFADLMVLLVCTPTVLVEVNSPPETWVLGEEMCKAVPFIEMMVTHASVLTILAISFERYYAICKPLKAGYICTKTRAFLICLCAWFLAGLLTSPMLFISQYELAQYSDGSWVPACLTPADTFWKELFFYMSISVFFWVPLLVLLVLYSIIARYLMADPGLKTSETFTHRARSQLILMLGTVVLSFFLCLMPFRVFLPWYISASAETIRNLGIEKYFNILYFCRTMSYVHSAINPVLYNLMSTKFRDGFIKVCGLKRKRRFSVHSRSWGKTSSFSYSSSRKERSIQYQYKSSSDIFNKTSSRKISGPSKEANYSNSQMSKKNLVQIPDIKHIPSLIYSPAPLKPSNFEAENRKENRTVMLKLSSHKKSSNSTHSLLETLALSTEVDDHIHLHISKSQSEEGILKNYKKISANHEKTFTALIDALLVPINLKDPKEIPLTVFPKRDFSSFQVQSTLDECLIEKQITGEQNPIKIKTSCLYKDNHVWL